MLFQVATVTARDRPVAGQCEGDSWQGSLAERLTEATNQLAAAKQKRAAAAEASAAAEERLTAAKEASAMVQAEQQGPAAKVTPSPATHAILRYLKAGEKVYQAG